MDIKNIDAIKEFSEKGFLRSKIWETENLRCNIYTFEPGGENKLHLHPASDEVVFCLEGEGEIIVGNERNKIKTRDTIMVKENEAHGYINTGDKRMVIVVVQCPTPVEHIPVNVEEL